MNNADIMTWSVVGILLFLVTIKIYFQARSIKKHQQRLNYSNVTVASAVVATSDVVMSVKRDTLMFRGVIAYTDRGWQKTFRIRFPF